MEEPIYRMSFVESLLVLVVIGLWLLAVISLAKKLERICNPPSIFPNYSLHKNTSISPSVRRDRRSNESVHSTLPPPQNFIRATSEPAIDASPRATIYIRSPSETCLHVKSTSTLRMSTMSQHLASPHALQLGRTTRNMSVGSLRSPGTSSYHIRTTKSPSVSNQHALLDPNRIPTIVRRSLLDLHRRTLHSNSLATISPIKCIVTAATSNSNGNGSISTVTAPIRTPLLTRYHGPNQNDEEDFYRGKKKYGSLSFSYNNLVKAFSFSSIEEKFDRFVCLHE